MLLKKKKGTLNRYERYPTVDKRMALKRLKLLLINVLTKAKKSLEEYVDKITLETNIKDV